MKRTLSLFLAAVLAAALLVCPAAASSAPWVQVAGKGTAAQSVSLQGLPGRYTGVQLTLTLNSAPDSLAFEQFASTPEGFSSYHLDGNNLTLYVTSKSFLNQGGTLSLGSLTADKGFTVVGVSGLKLLSVGPDDTQTLSYDRVSMSSGSGQGGGYDPGPGWTDPGSLSRYAVGTASGIVGGSLRISTTHAAQGEIVTVTAVADPGYSLSTVTVTDSAGRGISLTSLGGGSWSFTMPASAVTVNASFTLSQSAALPFLDVGQADWFREAVAYVYHAGLMNGTGPTVFAPEETTTRGMIVTILHRYAGRPAAAPSSFPDVVPGLYYSDAVSWAAANGVVNGYETGLFGPELAITREQMATILYRYAQHKGMNVSGRADLSIYWDASLVSPYAVDAMAWACHIGLINGVDARTLQPDGFATRAQVATILMRFCQYAEQP